MKVETPELDRRLDAMLTVLGRVETLLRVLVVIHGGDPDATA